MRHLSALQVEAVMDDSVPDLSVIPGLKDVEVDRNRVRCQVTGPIEPLPGMLAAAGGVPSPAP